MEIRKASIGDRDRGGAGDGGGAADSDHTTICFDRAAIGDVIPDVQRSAVGRFQEAGIGDGLPRIDRQTFAAGIDIGVDRSDRRSRVGKLTKQGSPELRWALYEAAQSACRSTSPDHAQYLELKQRGLSHTRASLTISRKLARRCYHTLRELGPAALQEAA